MSLENEQDRAIFQAPLVGVAIAFTAGILIDRWHAVPNGFAIAGSVLGLAAWACLRRGSRGGFDIAMLFASVFWLGAAYQGWRERGWAQNDIRWQVLAEESAFRGRGRIDSEPRSYAPDADPDLLMIPRKLSTLTTVALEAWWRDDRWQPIGGRIRIGIADRADDLHVGDEIEFQGRLQLPLPPGNPGEYDMRRRFARDGLAGTISIAHPKQQLIRLQRGWPTSLFGWLGVIRARANQRLVALGEDSQPLASALLLGDGSGLRSEDWDRYMRTGIVHVLAVSGQHLAVIAIGLGFCMTVARVPRRHGLVLIAALLLFYALLAGGRPPVMRAAVMAIAFTTAWLLGRPVWTANTLALAWLAILVMEPADVSDPGCQLSFLSVALLSWPVLLNRGKGPWWLVESDDPLDGLIEAARPRWERGMRWAIRTVTRGYVLTLFITLSVIPLVAFHYNMISLAGLIVSPPLLLLASMSLLLGFALLLLPVFTSILAPMLKAILLASEWLIGAADKLPGGSWMVADVPNWWIVIFYALLAVGLFWPSLVHRARALLLMGAGWTCLSLLIAAAAPLEDELRVTFLSVGHGTCVVIETPGGHKLLYDVGSMRGPAAIRQQIAPFLWSRGITRIDEVLLSHADLDHCNGLPALLNRFTVGKVTTTLSFEEKQTAGIQKVLAAMGRKGLELRTARRGDELRLGDVTIRVLHPPPAGIFGNENARSLVLLIEHEGHRILLTGDLEEPGLGTLLATTATPVDVLMAPHHGSLAANRPELAAWAHPKAVVACRGQPRSTKDLAEGYRGIGAVYLSTHNDGAVTIRSHAHALLLETFLSTDRINLLKSNRN